MQKIGANGITHRLLAAVLLAGCLWHLATGSAAIYAADLSSNKVLLNSKLALLDRLVNQSSSMKRIEQSDHVQAKELLTSAQTAYGTARQFLDEGNLEKSGQAIDEGLRSMSKASQFVVNIRHQEERSKREYVQLKERVVSFLDAFNAAVAKRDDNARALLDQVEIKALVAGAESDYEQGRYRDASEQLNSAAGKVEVALSKARDKETVVHELIFDSVEDEYAYEVQRNDSYEMLIKLMIREDTVVASAQTYIQKKVAENDRLKVEAVSLAKKGEFEGALSTIERATAQLVKALRLGGAGI